jgi:hypothetical protein
MTPTERDKLMQFFYTELPKRFGPGDIRVAAVEIPEPFRSDIFHDLGEKEVYSFGEFEYWVSDLPRCPVCARRLTTVSEALCHKTTPPRWTSAIEEQKSGHGFLTLPDNYMRVLGWQIGDELVIEVLDNNTFRISKNDQKA